MEAVTGLSGREGEGIRVHPVTRAGTERADGGCVGDDLMVNTSFLLHRLIVQEDSDTVSPEASPSDHEGTLRA